MYQGWLFGVRFQLSGFLIRPHWSRRLIPPPIKYFGVCCDKRSRIIVRRVTTRWRVFGATGRTVSDPVMLWKWRQTMNSPVCVECDHIRSLNCPTGHFKSTGNGVPGCWYLLPVELTTEVFLRHPVTLTMEVFFVIRDCFCGWFYPSKCASIRVDLDSLVLYVNG